MKYHAQSKCFTVTREELEYAVGSLIYSLKHIRKLAGLPFDRYKQEGPLDDAEHAQRGILDAARKLGIDMGADWGSDLDLRDKSEISSSANAQGELPRPNQTTNKQKG